MSAELLASLSSALANGEVAIEDFLGSPKSQALGGFELTQAAVWCKEAGSVSSAKTLLARAIEKEPDCVAAHYEIAVILRLEGKHLEALSSLQAAREAAPDDIRVAAFCAHLLYAIGAWEDATKILCGTPARSAEQQHDIDVLSQFGHYIRHFPRDRAVYNLMQIKLQRPYLSVEGVAGKIRAAVAAKRPFALIRMGDGEGAFANLGGQDESRYAALYGQNRQDFVRMWWGQQADRYVLGFDPIGHKVMDLTSECDIVGVPYESWLRHEYSIASTRGIPGLSNIHRFFLADKNVGPESFCSQHIHIELHTAGLLDEFLRGTKQIGLISCRSDLPSLLSTHFGIEDVDFYQIPGEQNYGQCDENFRDAHFPDTFRILQNDLSRDHHGRLFLVAGGVLGKYYVQTIKSYGGIAIDIGSLADGWCGINTRPGFNNRLAL